METDVKANYVLLKVHRHPMPEKTVLSAAV